MISPPRGTVAVQDAEPARPARGRKRALALGLLAFVAYNANFRLIGSGDTLPAQYLPLEIWRSARLDLDRVASPIARYTSNPYWIGNFRGHVFSMYPIVTPIVVAPLYLPAYLDLNLRGWTPVREDSIRREMEKLSASTLTAISVGLLFLLLRRRLPNGMAHLLTIAYAFGTSTWTISSQALWQHGLAELLVILALLAITAPPTFSGAVTVGVACGLMAANRPPDALIAVGILVAAALRNRRGALLMGSTALLAAIPFLAYDVYVFGSLSGPYGVASRPSAHFQSYFQSIHAIGVAGLLASPGKGLLVFAPFFLFLLTRFRVRASAASDRALEICLAVPVIFQLLVYAGYDWTGGSSYGPRLLTDVLPLLIFLLVPVLPALSRPAFAVLILSVAFSIGVQAVGAFFYPRGMSDQCNAVWNPLCAPYVVELRNGPASPDFLRDALNFLGRRLGFRFRRT